MAASARMLSSQPDGGSSTAVPASDPRRWLALLVMLAGTMLSPIDFFIVNIALPSIQADLHATAAAIKLVISGYAGAYAVFLITGGRLGDLYGRRRTFIGGLIGFVVFSALCGAAPTAPVLVLARIVQGVFAAVLMPQSLASIRALFPEHERPRAMALYGAAFGVGSIAGQLLGGIPIAANPLGLGWRSIFLINLPIIAVILPLAWKLLRETQAVSAARLDVRRAPGRSPDCHRGTPGRGG